VGRRRPGPGLRAGAASDRAGGRGAATESTPKTKTGDRLIWLDAETVRILKEHRTAQVKGQLTAGESWQDNDLILCLADGTPHKPPVVSRRFKRVAALAGLPVGRHSAASLARDAAVDPEIRRRTLGHADAAMTAHYTHIEAEAHKACRVEGSSHCASAPVAEAEGNRTRQRRGTPLTGFEER
jgi:integrase